MPAFWVICAPQAPETEFSLIWFAGIFRSLLIVSLTLTAAPSLSGSVLIR